MSEHLSSELARSVLRHARKFYVTRPWAMTIDPVSLSDVFESIESSSGKYSDFKIGKITLNTKVTLLDFQENQTCELTVVAPPESQPEKGYISFLSLLGSSLMGKTEGDVVSVVFLGTAMRFKVIKVH